MKAAFIGLGTMGGAMADNLQAAGHEVRAHDLRRVEGFAHWSASAAEAAAGCELVFTSLPGPHEVDKVAAQLKPVLPPGAARVGPFTNPPCRIPHVHRRFFTHRV